MAKDCEYLTGVKLDYASVTRAERIPVGGSIDFENAAQASGGHAAMAQIEFCRVQITARPTSDSDIRLEVWVPAGAAWNGKFQQLGNGGFAGALPYGAMRRALAQGYAVSGTDDGHQSKDMTDASWALNHPEKVRDFGWRAIHETAVESRQIMVALTSHQPTKAYFVGCSDGGREALMMAQRYPTYFDGIIAGAPASSWTRLMASAVERDRELGGQPTHLAQPQLSLLQHQALQSCGAGAGYLKKPTECRIDIAALQCKGQSDDSCLTAPQAKTAQVLYAEFKSPGSGKPLYGFMPGAEAVKGSWDAWLTGADDSGHAAGFAFAWNHMAFLVMKDPKLAMSKVTDQDIVRGEREDAPILNSDGGDLTAFRAHGGKLIQYHGWNDPAIAPGYSLEYREQLKAKLGTLDFYRLYMVPGMLHCGGGDAPTQVNWLEALEDWVEKGKSPGALTAVDGKGATQTLTPYE